jgi:hypothetical protein
LKVLEAYTRDVGRGVIRVDYDTMDTLDISTGDLVRITGMTNPTGAVIEQPGSTVTALASSPLTLAQLTWLPILTPALFLINPSNLAMFLPSWRKPSRSIPLTVETTDRVAISIDERYFADALDGIPFLVGDTLMVPYFGVGLRLKVIRAEPLVGVIGHGTKFTVTGEGVEEARQAEAEKREKERAESERLSKLPKYRVVMGEKDINELATDYIIVNSWWVVSQLARNGDVVSLMKRKDI